MINQHCRRCGCLWDAHPYGAVDNETYTIVRVMADNKVVRCKCKRFKPMNNLEYLEWVEKHGRPNL